MMCTAISKRVLTGFRRLRTGPTAFEDLAVLSHRASTRKEPFTLEEMKLALSYANMSNVSQQQQALAHLRLQRCVAAYNHWQLPCFVPSKHDVLSDFGLENESHYNDVQQATIRSLVDRVPRAPAGAVPLYWPDPQTFHNTVSAFTSADLCEGAPHVVELTGCELLEVLEVAAADEGRDEAQAEVKAAAEDGEDGEDRTVGMACFAFDPEVKEGGSFRAHEAADLLKFTRWRDVLETERCLHELLEVISPSSETKRTTITTSDEARQALQRLFGLGTPVWVLTDEAGTAVADTDDHTALLAFPAPDIAHAYLLQMPAAPAVVSSTDTSAQAYSSAWHVREIRQLSFLATAARTNRIGLRFVYALDPQADNNEFSQFQINKF